MLKKIIPFLFTGIILFASACSHRQKSFGNYEFCVIETTEQKSQSILSFYDKNLNRIGQHKIPYADYGSLFTPPVVMNNNVYAIPEGVPYVKELEIVLEYHLNDGTVTEMNLKKPGLFSFAVSSDSIYTTNMLNGTSSISKYNKKTGKVERINTPSTVRNYNFIYSCGDGVYVSADQSSQNKTKSYLIKINPDHLSIEWEKDISNIGSETTFFYSDNKYLYFTVPKDKKYKPESYLARMSFKDQKIKKINLPYVNPEQMKPYKDKLLISHNDMHGTGNNITVFDPKTLQSELLTLDHNVDQMEVKDDKIYILGEDMMYRYRLEKNKLLLEKKTNVQTKKGGSIYFYISSFFVK